MREEKYNPLTILIIDDEELGRKYLTTLLDGIGVGHVLAAENGAEALRMLEETDADVDLVICDIEMPEMNGYEFVRRVRYGTVPRYKDVPILIHTGHATEKNVQRAHTHKIDGFVTKPVTVGLLKVQIRDLLATGGEAGHA